MMINPGTGEPYNREMWTLSLEHNPNPVDKSWCEAMGAKTMDEVVSRVL